MIIKSENLNISKTPVLKSDMFLECFIKSLNCNEQEIDWLALQKKFEKDFPKAWQKRGFVLRIFSPDFICQASDGGLDYCYQDEKAAELHLKFLKLILADAPEFIKHAKVIKNSGSSTPFRIHISNEHSAKLDTLRKTDTLIKTVRWDPYCFVKNFIKSVTKSETNQHKEKLRLGPHKKFTVYQSGVYRRDNKPSPYPQNRLDEKKWLSSSQSTSLITATIQTSAFGHGKSRAEKLIGFSFDAEEALFNRLFIYDGGTISRPYEKATLEEAQKYYNEKVKGANPILFDNLLEFKAQAAKDLTKYTECLARLKWNINTSSVLIFSDAFEARCVAQTYARLMQERLRAQYQEMGKTLPSDYQVPIHYYQADSVKNLTAYTPYQQQEDIKFANQIMKDSNQIRKYLDQNDYEFLLIQTDPDAVLKLEHNKLPLILHLVNEGLIHIAEIVFNKTALAKKQVFSDYVMSQANKFPAAFTEIKKIDDEGNTPLHIAVLRGYYDLIPLWHSHLEIKNRSGEAPLYSAIKFNLLEGVDSLLKQGAKLDEKDNRGNTALHFACRMGHTEIVELLLKKGAKLDEIDWYRYTPFHIACSMGHTETVKLLLKKGAKLDEEIYSGLTALHLACEEGHTAIVELLLDEGANLDEKSGASGRTALHFACEKGHAKTVKLLLEKGAKLNEKSMGGWTALHFACWAGHIEIVKLLLDKGAAIDEKDHDRCTPLHLACKKGHTEAVKLLLEKSAKLDEKDKHDGTALHYACKNNYPEIVKSLLSKTTFTKEHKMHLDESIKNKNWGIVRLFLEKILEANDFKLFIEYTCSYLPESERKNLPKLLLGKYQEYIFTCNENQFNSGNNLTNFFFKKISNNEEIKAINRFNLALMDSTTILDPDTISTLKNGFLGKIIACFPKEELPTPKLHRWW